MFQTKFLVGNFEKFDLLGKSNIFQQSKSGFVNTIGLTKFNRVKDNKN